MIACVYGRPCVPFVQPVLHDLCTAAADAGGRIEPIAIEAAVGERSHAADVHRLYVLPFDPPTTANLPAGSGPLVRSLFPNAEVFVPFALQDLCWDKIALLERLIDRGVPVPDTFIGSEPAEVHEFVRQHRFAILKETHSSAGQGHLVLWFEDGQLVGDAGSQQYRVELVHGGARRLLDDRLQYPAPFYVQRLIVDAGPRWVAAGQFLRAYIVDREIVFWTERYRDRYRRPSDWIVTPASGARYRFLQDVAAEVEKIALRSIEAIGLHLGVVDLIRTGSIGPYVLDVDTDGHHLMIDRQFKQVPEYREFFNLDRYIAAALLLEPPVQPQRPRQRTDRR